MTAFKIDPRVRIVLRLALSAGTDAGAERLEQEARRLGLTGAEIDAAREGRSFDVLTSHALALALAVHAGDAARAGEVRTRALRAGIGPTVCCEVEVLATRTPPAG